jgi:hypothetical protein
MTAWALLGPIADAGDPGPDAGPDAEAGADSGSFVDTGTGDAGTSLDGAAEAGAAVFAQTIYAGVAIACRVDGSVVTTRKRLTIAIGNSTTWAELYGLFTVPATCELVSLQVYVAGPAPGVDLFVDDVSVVP